MRWQPEFVLDQREVEYAWHVAYGRLRHLHTRQDLSVRQLKTPEQNQRAAFIGVGGELVVRKYMGMETEWTDPLVPGLADLTLGDCTVDVKTASNPNSGLIARRPLKMDAYVLVIASLYKFTIVGWATAKEVSNDRNYGTLPGAYVIQQEHLRCIRELEYHAFHRAG